MRTRFDQLASVSATLNGSPFASDTPVTADGTYLLAVEASDLAGNVATAQGTFAIDQTPPVIGIAGVTNGEITNTAVTPIIIVSDPHLASETVTLDGSPFASGTLVTAPGPHTLSVSAADSLGNASSATVQFVIDETPPVITLGGFSDGGYYHTAVTPTYTATDDDLAIVDAAEQDAEADPVEQLRAALEVEAGNEGDLRRLGGRDGLDGKAQPCPEPTLGSLNGEEGRLDASSLGRAQPLPRHREFDVRPHAQAEPRLKGAGHGVVQNRRAGECAGAGLDLGLVPQQGRPALPCEWRRRRQGNQHGAAAEPHEQAKAGDRSRDCATPHGAPDERFSSSTQSKRARPPPARSTSSTRPPRRKRPSSRTTAALASPAITRAPGHRTCSTVTRCRSPSSRRSAPTPRGEATGYAPPRCARDPGGRSCSW